jgi:multidrug efflux system outer membrane protein
MSSSRKLLKRLSLGAMLAVLGPLSGCTVGPNYRRPAVPLPPAYSDANGKTPSGDLGSLEWWQLFRDPALEALIRKASTNNPNVKLAAAHLERLQAESHALRASYLPEVDAQDNETLQRISPIGLPQDRTSGNPAGSATIFGAQASWEIDFWGRYRRANEAERAALLAGKAAQDAVQTTLVADVASAYFDLLALQEELRLARERLALRRSSLELVTARERAGISSIQEVHSQQAWVEKEGDRAFAAADRLPRRRAPLPDR